MTTAKLAVNRATYLLRDHAVLRGTARSPAFQSSVHQPPLCIEEHCRATKKRGSHLARHQPFCSHVDHSSADPLDSSQPRERPATALLHSRRATQNHPNGRILDQYALRRLTACLVDLTSIPDGQRIKSWCPDWADFHFLRDPRSRDPYIHVTVANLVALWVGECFCCRDGQYQ